MTDPNGEPAHPDQRGSFDARCLRHVGAQRVEVDVEDLHHPPLVGGQRRRLQVREQSLDLLDGSVLDQALERQLPSDESDRGDEELRIVTAQLGGRRRHGRSAEVDEAEVTVVDDEILLVELAVYEPVVVQGGEELPELAEPWTRVGAGEDRVRDAVDVAEAVGLDQQRAAATQDEQGVVGGGGPGGHHGVGGDTGLRGEERHQCFVLDLTQPAETDGRTGSGAARSSATPSTPARRRGRRARTASRSVRSRRLPERRPRRSRRPDDRRPPAR